MKLRIIAVAAAAVLLSAADARAQSVYKNADWLRKPTAGELMKVWPTEALKNGTGGQATIHCSVSVQGALFDCKVTFETPPGAHFGDAALALAPQFLMRPATLDGKPVVSSANIPINFKSLGYRPPPDAYAGKPVVSANMAWPEAPSYAAVAAAYPAKARAARVGGRVSLDCEINREGRLFHCDTLTEEPKHEGFGDAAKALSKAFRAFPTLSDGKPVTGAHLQLPFVFDPAMLDAGQPVIGKAQWAALPNGQDTVAAFGKVVATGTAHARLACTVQQGGSVADCSVQSEDPAGTGVGQAALGLSPHFRLTTWTAEGLPTVGGTINIPLRYEAGAKPEG
ncbi:TonB family protein [Phenylobacterium sp.]|uniref:TonB family protein n=1 Tax=Phenylobacterium sp. TaxID=1871053 RepID=UPI002C5123F9|nr:TonB family protein [Phenylobacterium sp.]HLZ75807.1 TonB family protein [Phenylobacterium sp.]